LPTSWKAVEAGYLPREDYREKFRVRMRMVTKGIVIVRSNEGTAALLAKAGRRPAIRKGVKVRLLMKS